MYLNTILPRYVTLPFPLPLAQTVKNLPAMQETRGLIPGSGRSPGKGNGSPLKHSHPGNPVDKGAWGAIVHGVTKSPT